MIEETLVLKLLEGCLTLKLKPVLLKAVPVTQSAYQAGRSTIENIIWVRNMVHAH